MSTIQPPGTITDPWIVLDIPPSKVISASVRLGGISAIAVSCKGAIITDGEKQVCCYSITQDPPLLWWYGNPAGLKLQQVMTELFARNKLITQPFQLRDMNTEWTRKFDPEAHIPLCIQYTQQNEGNPPALDTILSWNMDPTKVSTNEPVNALFQILKQLQNNVYSQ